MSDIIYNPCIISMHYILVHNICMAWHFLSFPFNLLSLQNLKWVSCKQWTVRLCFFKSICQSKSVYIDVYIDHSFFIYRLYSYLKELLICLSLVCHFIIFSIMFLWFLLLYLFFLLVLKIIWNIFRIPSWLIYILSVSLHNFYWLLWIL